MQLGGCQEVGVVGVETCARRLSVSGVEVRVGQPGVEGRQDVVVDVAYGSRGSRRPGRVRVRRVYVTKLGQEHRLELAYLGDEAGQVGVDGGVGDDTLIAGTGNNTVLGGDGIDTIDYTGVSTVNVNLNNMFLINSVLISY